MLMKVWQPPFRLNNGFITTAPAAYGRPFMSFYNNQQHVGYLGPSGLIYDIWVSQASGPQRPGQPPWNVQQINGGGNTAGPAAVAGPFIGVFKDQQHFCYVDKDGSIWDSWYDGSGHWSLQKLNSPTGTSPKGNTGAPGIAAWGGMQDVVAWVDPSGTQQHFTYQGGSGVIYDAFYDSSHNNWQWQTTNAGGNTSGPPALTNGLPNACTFHQQQHIAYIGIDGSLWDSWYGGAGPWNLQKLNSPPGEAGGRTPAPAALTAEGIWQPAIYVDPSNKQQHFLYVGVDGAIYDTFWDGGGWRWQKLSGSGTTAPATATNPSAIAVKIGGNLLQPGFLYQIVAYWKPDDGAIWDLEYGGETGVNLPAQWDAAQLNTTDATPGETPALKAHGPPFISFTSFANGVLHFTYNDLNGTIWDVFRAIPGENIPS
jgi:hypothetical protein